MTKGVENKRARVARILIQNMFKVKPGETVAITADSGSDKLTVEALEKASSEVGGLPMVIYTPRAKQESQAGMIDWPAEALTAALCKVDVWIEMQSMVILYSDIWETAMKQNKKLRYLIIADSTIDSLERVFTGFSVMNMKALLLSVKQKAMLASDIRITSDNGTDVSYKVDLNNTFDYDDGDFSKAKFGTAPGFVNIIPKVNSMKGRIVFDFLQNHNNNTPLEFIIKNGKIAEVNGRAEEAKDFSEYLGSFQDPNMYKISHNMLGFNPNVRHLSGELVEDERVWGGANFGFGHTSALDLPPFGQEAASHFDGVVTKVNVFFDDVAIIKDGEVCHPELKPLAEKLLHKRD